MTGKEITSERFIIWESGDCPWLIEGELERKPSIAPTRSREPLLVGARLLLDLGYDPQTLLTTRWRNKSFDNFVPAPIEKLSRLSVVERDKEGLAFCEYQKFTKERLLTVRGDRGDAMKEKPLEVAALQNE